MDNNITIFDVHSHIHFSAYDKDRDEVIQRAGAVGAGMIAVGVNFFDSEKAVALAHKYPDNIWASVGFHPNDLNKETMEGKPEIFDPKKFLELAKDKKVVAIGECGLEYYRLGVFEERVAARIKKNQTQAFMEQARIAGELGKPLMIHCRPSKGADDANEDLYKLLITDCQPARQGYSGRLPIPKIMHFYSGGLEMAKKFAEIGCYFSFGGVITFARDKDEIIKYLPLDRIMVETDAPYVSPEPYRGKRNEPAFVIEVVKKLSEIKNIPLEDLSEKLYENSKKVFDLD